MNYFMLTVKEFRTCHSQICHFLYWLIWAKGSLNSLHLPKERYSKGGSVIINLPRSFIDHSKLILITERKLEVNATPRRTLSQTVIPLICSSKGPFIVPKNHLLSPKVPAFLHPFPDLNGIYALNSH